MGISTEILRRASEQGLRVGEVSVHVSYKGAKTSTHNPLRHGLSVLSTVIRLVVEERPLFYLGIPGALMLIIGIGFAIWTVQLYTSVRYIVTNVALAAVTFTLIGTFTLFTAVTLYAIIRLTQKVRAERHHECAESFPKEKTIRPSSRPAGGTTWPRASPTPRRSTLFSPVAADPRSDTEWPDTASCLQSNGTRMPRRHSD